MAEPGLALRALMLEAALGYPDDLHKRVPHPISAVGWAIASLERRWNTGVRDDVERRWLGVVCVGLVAGGAAAFGYVAQRTTRRRSAGPAITTLLATTGLAQRSLYDHVRAVLDPLERGDLLQARKAVARIVGRDTAELDESEIAAAALESLAESFNDGVVAPAFWLALGGVPGLFAYKAINTADSLIGHREPRWRAFGWAAARTDDVLNLAPARLSGLLLVLAGRGGLKTMMRDAPGHLSPNAGWPEAAMAGALGVTLGGPCRYEGVLHERVHFGERTAAHNSRSPAWPDALPARLRALVASRRSAGMAALMVQGCGSDVGKSTLVAGLCRLYANRGLTVRPFKPQNMSNNAAVTADGGEIGRAQALQALACRTPATVHMNPVLLKPQSDIGAQVIVRGRMDGFLSARDFQSRKKDLLAIAVESFQRLRAEADLVLVEGAGSPAETNLRANDIANMGFAHAANLPVVLVGDIDRGHVIAALVGRAHCVERGRPRTHKRFLNQ